jgi:hypothetical protein
MSVASHGWIVVALGSNAPAGVTNSALAYSTYGAKGPCVTILMNRLEGNLKASPIHGGSLLGHVLAHEICHVLQGVARHSLEGIMKGHWSLQETMDMPFRRLRFTEEDRELILIGLGTPEHEGPQATPPEPHPALTAPGRP